jgi:hypothetical protein
MAFQIDTVTPQGLTAPAAYCRIEDMRLTTNTISFVLRRYKDRTAEQFLFDVYYTAPYAMNGSNPFEQGYAYLRALPEFEKATDVLVDTPVA